MVIIATTENATDLDSGMMLERPRLAVVPSYITALQEGLKACRSATTQDEINGLENGNPELWQMLSKTYANAVGTPDGCLEDIFWLTKEDSFFGFIGLRSEMAENRRRNGGTFGRELRPAMRNQGYGTIGVQLIKEICKERGYTSIETVTAHDNIAAITSVKKCGAELIEEISDPDPKYFDCAAVRYRISLEGSVG